MKLLIINAASENDATTKLAIESLTKNAAKHKIINASDLTISYCIGCCTCMLETPGTCCLKDDYAEIFQSLFAFDTVIFISDTALDFIHHKTINILQRMFPLVTVFSCFQNGKILHTPRYDKSFRLGLLYKGDVNQQLLNNWFTQYAEHFSSSVLGVYPIEQAEEVFTCIS